MATLESFDPDYPNRAEEVKEFDDTKAGIKGLVDTGLEKIPKFFIHLPENRPETPAGDNSIKHQQALPVINLDGLAGGERRREIVEEIGRASEEWGFFQIVNHGIPSKIMEEIVEGVRRFNEEDVEGKAKIYSRDGTKKVRFSTNFDLFRSRAADWRDTLTCSFDLGIDPQDLPSVCREIMMEYSKIVTKLAETLCELLSEALGLQPTFLQKDMNCVKLQDMVSHYYPPCPEPQLTLGSTKHSDPALLTILLQDHNGGLQFLRCQQWVDVTPIPGALVINIGDILQILSNGRFKSMGHRVLSSHLGPRISVAAFFNPNRWGQTPYGPIKELISESNPQVYRETTMKDYITYFRSNALGVGAALNSLKL